MSKSRLPKSIRKSIRKEKSRIHREILDKNKQNEEIAKLYEKFSHISNPPQYKKSL